MITKLVLGTVELGMDYGIDGAPRPTHQEAFDILDAAYAAGITTFDTAATYGGAEELLGEWMARRELHGEVQIVSKGLTQADVRRSLERLQADRLSAYLLHSTSNGSFADLEEAQRAGLVAHIGASVYEPEEVRPEFEYVQAPYNIFDRRFHELTGATFFARSPFLQGLLLMDPARLPAHLTAAQEPLDQFIHIAHAHHLSPLTAALLFALASPAAYVVFGVKTRAELEEILHAAATPVPEGFIKEVEQMPAVDRTISNPSRWGMLKALGV
jgi:aryl-alcohol dehydrogenase-like predicted oxidoreductase